MIDYLGRYTKRIALTPNRLINLKDNQVSLKYRDYRDNKSKVIKLSSEELVRRYALHILPKGFMRVRYHGFLANAVRAEKLQAIRRALKVVKVKIEDKALIVKGNPCCPDCGKNRWHYVGVINRLHWNPG